MAFNRGTPKAPLCERGERRTSVKGSEIGAVRRTGAPTRFFSSLSCLFSSLLFACAERSPGHEEKKHQNFGNDLNLTGRRRKFGAFCPFSYCSWVRPHKD